LKEIRGLSKTHVTQLLFYRVPGESQKGKSLWKPLRSPEAFMWFPMYSMIIISEWLVIARVWFVV